MIDDTFTLLLLGAHALLLIYAAVRDVQTYLIRNRLVLVVAALAPLWWIVDAVALSDMLIRLVVAGAVFGGLALLYRFGMMGGGDVKLAAAIALWFTPGETLRFIVVMALAGGLVTIGAIILRKIRGKPGDPKIPYGVAIAVGGLWNVAQRFLNHFA
ncbi:A24 family peptidase [Sphingomicrobium clamense]|uniref:Prepilin peptidase n=1 Tax=Sphingomicrobium clamense TaxID=2851013 RepID=A0ABS6V6M0_9SPHN|nr:prepilin peptidase [Sphingomicrobium sp. B8]MBW0144832.1 prepilin peptidase [Sphingomicrobium sp. B8]